MTLMAEQVAEPAAATVRPERQDPDDRRIPAGWRVIGAKELADHILSVRFLILLVLLALVAVFSVYTVAGEIRSVASAASGREDLFLLLFTSSSSPTDDFAVSFALFVSLIGPFLGIAFGFDAVSSERSEGTLPRLVSQPIHRDDVINGKFFAGLVVIILIFAAVMMLIAGVGLFRLGVVPDSDQVLRLLAWFVVAVIYVAFWLAFATLCSVVFRRAATAFLVMIAAWLILNLFWPLIVSVVARVVAPGGQSVDEQLAAGAIQDNLSRISPATLFQELTEVLTNPEVRWLGLVTREQVDRTVPGAALSFDQSLLIAWPQAVLLVAGTVICFAVAYIVFMRQEVRA